MDHNNECCARCGFNQEILNPFKKKRLASFGLPRLCVKKKNLIPAFQRHGEEKKSFSSVAKALMTEGINQRHEHLRLRDSPIEQECQIHGKTRMGVHDGPEYPFAEQTGETPPPDPH